jgi:hypothetical protein
MVQPESAKLPLFAALVRRFLLSILHLSELKIAQSLAGRRRGSTAPTQGQRMNV